jgi:PAS domain S-box-containing protein
LSRALGASGETMPASPGPIAGVRVLVAEDEPLTAEAICELLRGAGCEIVGSVDNGPAAIETATQQHPDIILMDVRLKGEMDGIQAAEIIRRQLPVPVVYLLAFSETAMIRRAKAQPACGYLVVPYDLRSLPVVLEATLSRFRIEQKMAEVQLPYAAILNSSADGIVATDAEGRVRFMNPVAERLTGWSIAYAQGRLASEVLRFVDKWGQPLDGDLVARVLAARASVSFDADTHIAHRNSRHILVDGSVAPVFDDLARLVGTTISLRELTGVRG